MDKNNISMIPVILSKYKDYSADMVDITSKEAAIILHLSARTLEGWRAKRKNLNYNRLPGGITYNLQDVLDYKKSSVVNTVDIAA
jgi:hypothetical protein